MKKILIKALVTLKYYVEMLQDTTTSHRVNSTYYYLVYVFC